MNGKGNSVIVKNFDVLFFKKYILIFDHSFGKSKLIVKSFH